MRQILKGDHLEPQRIRRHQLVHLLTWELELGRFHQLRHQYHQVQDPVILNLVDQHRRLLQLLDNTVEYAGCSARFSVDDDKTIFNEIN